MGAPKGPKKVNGTVSPEKQQTTKKKAEALKQSVKSSQAPDAAAQQDGLKYLSAAQQVDPFNSLAKQSGSKDALTGLSKIDKVMNGLMKKDGLGQAVAGLTEINKVMVNAATTNKTTTEARKILAAA